MRAGAPSPAGRHALSARGPGSAAGRCCRSWRCARRSRLAFAASSASAEVVQLLVPPAHLEVVAQHHQRLAGARPGLGARDRERVGLATRARPIEATRQSPVASSPPDRACSTRGAGEQRQRARSGSSSAASQLVRHDTRARGAGCRACRRRGSARDQQAAGLAQHAPKLVEHLVRALDVLDHLEADDDVEASESSNGRLAEVALGELRARRQPAGALEGAGRDVHARRAGRDDARRAWPCRKPVPQPASSTSLPVHVVRGPPVARAVLGLDRAPRSIPQDRTARGGPAPGQIRHQPSRAGARIYGSAGSRSSPLG